MTIKSSLSLVTLQRDREAKAFKIFLMISIPCSIAFHIVILFNIGLANFWNNSLPKEDPIEVVAVESTIEKIEDKAIEPIEEKIAEPKLEEAIESIPEPVAVAPTPQIQNPLRNLPNLPAIAPPQQPEELTPKVLTGTQPTSTKIPVSNSFGNGNMVNHNVLNRIRGILGGKGTSPTGAGISPSSTGNIPSKATGSGKIRCQNCAKPDYPSQAKEQGLEGQAKVAVDVDADGNVTNVRILNSSGYSELDQAAIEAAKKWKFTPSESGRSGVPAKVDFQLEGSDYSRQRREQQIQTDLPSQVSTPQVLPTNDTGKIVLPSIPPQILQLTPSLTPQTTSNPSVQPIVVPAPPVAIPDPIPLASPIKSVPLEPSPSATTAPPIESVATPVPTPVESKPIKSP